MSGGTADAKVQRRLAAIFAADVEGYSRLMGADEVGTLRTLTAHREIMDRLIGEHGGRIANTAGDSVLAEFPSVVDAVQAAVEVQEALRTANATLPEDRQVRFRIGVHVGDVMVRRGDLFGEGVNVAARLQAIAKPGGVCLSGSAHEHVRKILPLAYTDLGLQRAKNIQEPVRAYAVNGPASAVVETPSSPAVRDRPLPLPDRPSIVVLPFTNLSGDPEQEFFADGMVEDITTALSRIRSLFVTGRNSSFTYKGKAVDVKQVGRDLGVRYVLEGSIRRSGPRLRVTAQLIETEQGSQIWAERYDRKLDDLFEVQDEITKEVAGAIEPQLLAAEAHRLEQHPTSDLQAWECAMRSLPHIWRFTLEETEVAQEWLRRAIERDPTYAYAHALMGWSYLKLWGITSTDLQPGIVQKGEEFARAAALEPHRVFRRRFGLGYAAKDKISPCSW